MAKKFNWENRMNDPNMKFIENQDGSPNNTHIMFSFGGNGKHYVAPQVVEMDGKLVKLSIDEAIEYSKTNGAKVFDNKEEAEAYAANGYKKNQLL